MAISNYGELKSTVSTHLFHQRFVGEYDNATIKFEAAANRRLRVRPMETFIEFNTVDGAAPLPPDYLLWRTVLWLGRTPNPELDYVDPAYISQAFEGRVGPKLFTIEGEVIYIFPKDDNVNAYELDYYQKIPTLVGANTNSNWLLTEYPNAYLFGLMVEAASDGRNAEMAQLYKARRDEVFQEIIQRYALTTGATSPSVRSAEYF